MAQVQCTCRELTEEDIPGSQFEKDINKATKNELKFWLRCRNLKFKCSETKAELLSRVRHNLGKKFKLVDPDPGKCYTRSMKANCPLCSNKVEKTEPIINELHGEWTKSTKVLPKQFSYINIQNHAKKSSKKENITEKPLQKGYKFFYENYVFNVLGKSSLSPQETKLSHVKCKCYKSPKNNETPHTVVVTLSSNGDITYAKCSCVAGAGGYCNHTIALLYLIDHTIKISAEKFPEVFSP